jgi:predicted metal-binding membrane protein
MANAGVALFWPRQRTFHRLLRRRPELGAAAVVGLAWVLLVALDIAHGGTAMTTSAHPAMPGMAAGLRPPDAGGLSHMIIMTVAMMGPAALSGIRHTGVNSLRWRQQRAMAEFGLVYLSVWTAFAIVVLTGSSLASGVSEPAALCVVLAIAAAWQLTPYKRHWLRECHRSVPLPPRGWRAEKAALTFGFRNGRACLGSCWCLMLIMVVAPSGQLLWSVALCAVSTLERLVERPRRATRLAAVALGIAAFWTLALGIS